jgi:5-methylcytosine-specific restriction enzyme subunit McrC
VIIRSISEWGELAIEERGDGDAVSRRIADALMGAARGLEPAGETILEDRGRYLRAQQVVGVLACDSARLQILPKIDGLDRVEAVRVLIHMLARVFDLDIKVGVMSPLEAQRIDLLEIIIGAFCERLFAVLRRGLPRRYLPQEQDLSALRGRLDLKRQFTTLAVQPQRLACGFDELGPDIALNQVMKAALNFLLRNAASIANQRRLRELLLSYGDVSAVEPKSLDWAAAQGLDRTNSQWRDLVDLARFFLRREFQTTHLGGRGGYSLLFAMNTLFEEYVGRSIRGALSGGEINVSLQGPKSHVLVSEHGQRRFATKPDIVLRDADGRVRLIVDTKWKRLSPVLDDPKRGISQADIYQMLAYARVYGARRLALLYPHHMMLGASDGVLERFRFSGDVDVELSVATVSLADLGSVKDRLGDMMRGLLQIEGANLVA